MQITLTRAMLKAKDACADALRDLEEFFGAPDNWTVDWTRDKQIEILKSPLRKYIGWGYDNDLFPWWSMSGSNLSGSNLSGSDLRWSNLNRSNLSGSNLSESELRWSNLNRSNLSGSNLSRSDLRWSNLSRSNLSGSNLSESELRWSNLSGSNLSDAKVCLCNSAPCTVLRATLEAAGWKPGSDGLLERMESEHQAGVR